MNATIPAARRRKQRYKGVILAIVKHTPGAPRRFRVRVGRDVGYAPVGGLSREWLDAYIQALRKCGRSRLAFELLQEWLATTSHVETGGQ